MIYRAYAPLTLKDVNAEQRTLAGVATSPQPDRVGDIIESKGAQFANPLPLLLYHDAERPVGQVRLDKATADGIRFHAQIADVSDPGPLRDRVNEAWQSVKAGLIRGVSIGFRVLDDGIELLKSGGVRFTSIEILELSLVAIPANQRATIDTIKSFAVPSRRIPDPAVPASRDRSVSRTNMDTNTFSKRKQTLTAEKTSKQAAMNALLDGRADAADTMNADDQTKFDDLAGDIEAIDGELKRIETAERLNKAAAVPVLTPATTTPATVVQIREQTPPGISLARYAICKAQAFLSHGAESAGDIAARCFSHDAQVLAAFQKTAVAPATTGVPAWAGNLIQPGLLVSDFLEYLRPSTIVGRFGLNGIPDLVRMPFNSRIAGQTTGGSGYWVGEGKPKPLTKFDFDVQTLLWTKVAAIAVISDEVARLSTPSAEMLVRNGLRDACVATLDKTFIDPNHAAVTGVSPASITNGVTPLTVSGTDAVAARKDLAKLIDTYVAGNNALDRLVLIMPATIAFNLAQMVNPLGQPEFPTISLTGGSFAGIPIIASQYASLGGTDGNLVIAANAGRIGLADDGQVSIDASREASLEMSDAPTSDATTSTGAALVSMWQANLLALRAERMINWHKFRTDAVAFYNNVLWGTS